MLFVNDIYQTEKCVASSDLFIHPVIKAFLLVIAILWFLLLLVILFVFLKYRNLKTRYSKLGEETQGENGSPTLPGEIELQDQPNYR